MGKESVEWQQTGSWGGDGEEEDGKVDGKRNLYDKESSGKHRT
jgi:hypothetical protein